MEGFNILSNFDKLVKNKDTAFAQYKELKNKVTIHFLCNRTLKKINYLLTTEKSLPIS